jgi:hypothetical protein
MALNMNFLQSRVITLSESSAYKLVIFSNKYKYLLYKYNKFDIIAFSFIIVFTFSVLPSIGSG